MTLKKDGTPRKAGSGRTKGAVSLTVVKMVDLQAKFADMDHIVVGRKFAEQWNLIPTNNKPTLPIDKEIAAGITVITI